MVNVTGGGKLVTLKQLLRVPEVESSAVCVSSLCDDNHTVRFTNKKFLVKKNDCPAIVGGPAAGYVRQIYNEQNIMCRC